MNLYEECLQIIEDNRSNPHTDFWRMTLSLKHWQIRKQVYLGMVSLTKTEEERRLLVNNKWGEDKMLEHLIMDRKMPLQHLLDLVFQMQEIEWAMNATKIYNHTQKVIPILDILTEAVLPIWKEEVIKLKIQKDHKDLRTMLRFAFNQRSYDEEIIDFTVALLNTNF